jgi:hypothetical protein
MQLMYKGPHPTLVGFVSAAFSLCFLEILASNATVLIAQLNSSAFFVPFPHMSFTGQTRRAWANYGSSYTNQDLLPEDLYYGNLPKVSAAGQLGKRMRSNSDEDSILRMSQVQAWLKDQATAEDFEKIWRIFLGMPISMVLFCSSHSH